MKNFNLIKRLWTDSHEKQSPQRFARYAAMLIMLLTLGVGQMWGWETYQLRGDHPGWSATSWTFSHGTTTTLYMANNDYFKLYHPDWGDNSWLGGGADQNTYENGDGGHTFYQKGDNSRYVGPSGMVCFHMSQDGDYKTWQPWVWITRPTWYLKHNWNNSTWTWKSLTDNGDGTYYVDALYGNQTTVNHGDNQTEGGTSGSGWGAITATTVGSPTTGTKCRFVFDASNSTVKITKFVTVTFNMKGHGSAIDSREILYNTKTSQPSNPSEDGWTFGGWYSNSECTTSFNFNTAITANTTIYAKWTEKRYSVTIAANNSSMGTLKIDDTSKSWGSANTIGVTNKITVTPNLGYYFTGWSAMPSGMHKVTDNTTGAGGDAYFYADAAGKTITANFANKWGLFSSINSWGDPTPLGNYSTSASKDYGYIEVSLAANTQYSFKIRDFSTGNNYKPSSNTEITYANKATARTMSSTATGEPNQTIMTAGAGTYRFTWNITDKSIEVTYPTSYTVTFGKGTGGSSVSASVESSGAITSGQYAASGKDITFTQTPATGYTFKGWYTASTGGSAIACMASDNVYDDIATNINVYAQYNAKTYTITLDQQTSATGYGSSGSTSLTATYDAAFPSITLPTAANGYAFMGYYSATGGGGTQFTDASGNLLANITDYSDASGHWKYDNTKTLYAYYKKAEITAITFDAAVVEASGTVSFAVTVSPTPTGTTKLCFTVLHSNDNPLAEQPTVTYSAGKYSFTAPEASGTYKVEAVLRTGGSCDGGTELDTEVASFQVAGLHTVTVRYKCGDEVIKASTTATGRPLDWSDAMTAPDIFGYTFSSWEAGDGVTLTDDNGTTTKTTTTAATIKIKAIYDGSLTANYNQNAIIYFKNTLGWSDVYVNFYTASDWDSSDNGSGSQKGAGNKNVTNRNKHMTQIDDTDIWYYSKH